MFRRSSRAVTARDLPGLRSALVDAYTAALDRPSARDEDTQAALSGARTILRAAALFYVAAPMVDLAVAASDELPDDALAAEDLLPAPTGLLVWGAALPTGATPLGPMVPRGMFWRESLTGVNVTWLVAAEDHPDELQGPWARLPLFPSGQTSFGKALPADDGHGGRHLAGTTIATWLLMGQPILIDRRELKVNATSNAKQRRRKVTAVTTVDLRAIYRPNVPPAEDTDTARRHLRFRHVVRGHWRQQAFGPGRALRRPTWIAAHEKGPDGAPLVVSERVMVWRR